MKTLLFVLFASPAFASMTSKTPTELTVRSFDKGVVMAVDKSGKSYSFPRESVKNIKLVAGTTKLYLHLKTTPSSK